MICPYCNNETPDDRRRCEICNASFDVPKNEDMPLTRKHILSNVFIYFYSPIFSIVGVYVLIFSIAFLKTGFFGAIGLIVFSLGLILYGLGNFLGAIDAFVANKKFFDIIETIKKISKYCLGSGFSIAWFLAIIHFLTVVFKSSGAGTGLLVTIFCIPFALVGLLFTGLFRKKGDK